MYLPASTVCLGSCCAVNKSSNLDDHLVHFVLCGVEAGKYLIAELFNYRSTEILDPHKKMNAAKCVFLMRRISGGTKLERGSIAKNLNNALRPTTLPLHPNRILMCKLLFHF